MTLISNPLNIITNTVNNEWLVFNLKSKKEYILDNISFYILICSFDYIEYKKLIVTILEKFPYPIDFINDTIKYLQTEELIIDKNYLDTISEYLELLNYWECMGWEYASFYFLGTYNMQFLDAIKERNVANDNMLRFHNEQNDISRCLVFDEYYDLIPLDKISLEMNINKSLSYIEKVKLIATFSSGITSKMKPIWGGDDLYMKCHPSGGARHPTELYLFQNKSKEILKKGLYHVQIEPNVLKLIVVDDIECNNIYTQIMSHGLNRSVSNFDTVFIYTSVIYRNQYRYRESRTLRTIHMDIGHVMSTTELVAAELGLQIYSGYLYGDLSVQPNILEEVVLSYIAISENNRE